MEVLIVFAVLAFGGVARYFDDVSHALKSGGGVDAMERLQRLIDLAEVVSLAVLADGEITPRERQLLSEALADNAPGANAEETLDALEARARLLTDERSLRAAIRVRLLRLDVGDKERALAMVARLVDQAGSRAAATEPSGYRDRTPSDPDALFAIFAEELGVSAARAAEIRAQRR